MNTITSTHAHDVHARKPGVLTWGLRFFLAALAALLVTLLLAPAGRAVAQSAPASSPDLAAIDRYVAGQMQEQALPGLALAIVHGDQVVALRGYGVAGPGGEAVTPQTPFMIGSVSKSFTALAVMQLVEAGKIDLDAPVQRYIPWFTLADPAAAAQITPRQLLTQTSGLGRAGDIDLTRENRRETALEESVRMLSTVMPDRVPGTTHEYVNANYSVLGLLVQVVSGQPFERYVEQHIFAPLAMTHATTDPARAPGIAIGHNYWFGWPRPMETPYVRGALPAGYLVMSAEDLSHYMIAQLNGGRYAGRTVLSPAGITTMHISAVPADEPGQSYALGWYVGPTTDGTAAVWHGGLLPNFNCMLTLVPDQGWGVVVLMNASSQMHHREKEAIADGVISMLNGKQPVPYTGPNPGLINTSAEAIAMLPLVTMLLSCIGLWRWSRSRIHRSQWRVWGGLLSVWVVNGFVLGLFLVVMPLVNEQNLVTTFHFVSQSSPDLALILYTSIIVALGWSIIYPIALWRLVRVQRADEACPAPPTVIPTPDHA